MFCLLFIRFCFFPWILKFQSDGISFPPVPIQSASFFFSVVRRILLFLFFTGSILKNSTLCRIRYSVEDISSPQLTWCHCTAWLILPPKEQASHHSRLRLCYFPYIGACQPSLFHFNNRAIYDPILLPSCLYFVLLITKKIPESPLLVWPDPWQTRFPH